MKKRYRMRIIALILIFSNTSYGQSLTEIFYPKVCNCFEENFNVAHLDIDLQSKCFEFSSDESQKKLEDYIVQQWDTTAQNLSYEDGFALVEKIRQQLFDDLLDSLLKNCDSYYQFLLELKKITLKNMSKEMSQQQADSLSLVISKGDWTEETMWEMGSYEAGNGNLIKAKEYFNKGLDKNPSHTPTLFFMGIVNDAEEDYNAAVYRYSQVIASGEKSLDFLVRLFLEVSKRKAVE